LYIDDLAIQEPVKQFVLGFVLFDSNTCIGCGVPGQELAKLTELDQSRVWVIKDIAFSQCGVADEHLVIFHEEREIR
jgi:hypothetical protein